jgi:hypothetical protein
VGVTAKNVTSNSQAAPQGYTKLVALNITISTTANVATNVTLRYPCSIPSTKVAPYIIKNNTWVAITPFTVDAASCTVTFTVPKDPVVGLLTSYAASTTVTTVQTTTPTTVLSTAPTTTVQQSSFATGGTIAVVVIIIIIAAVVAYVILRNPKKSRWPRR